MSLNRLNGIERPSSAVRQQNVLPSTLSESKTNAPKTQDTTAMTLNFAKGYQPEKVMKLSTRILSLHRIIWIESKCALKGRNRNGVYASDISYCTHLFSYCERST